MTIKIICIDCKNEFRVKPKDLKKRNITQENYRCRSCALKFYNSLRKGKKRDWTQQNYIRKHAKKNKV